MTTNHGNTDKIHRNFLNTNAAIIGVLIGGLLIVSGIYNKLPSATWETLAVCAYLTVLVAFCGLKMPTPFASSRPRLAVFTLVFLCGHVSLFFDSFAVVLLLLTMKFSPHQGSMFSAKFSEFIFKVMCSFTALTVGGGFWVGELWGVPYFISSQMTSWYAGLPLLITSTPFCILIGILTALLSPVRIEPVKMDSKQLRSLGLFAGFLLALVISHNPLVCLGALLVGATLIGRIPHMIKSTLHELDEGAIAALGLIVAAILVQSIPGWGEWVQSIITINPIIAGLGAAVSSPFVGAMLPGADSPEVFFAYLAAIQTGAPVFVWSSLVAIVVFRESIDHEDLPGPLRWVMEKVDFTGKGVAQEMVTYTITVLPLAAILGVTNFIAVKTGLYVTAYNWLHSIFG